MNAVKFYRLEKGFTQEELSRLVGISRQSLIAIEKGTLPRSWVIVRLSNILDVPVYLLFPDFARPPATH